MRKAHFSEHQIISVVKLLEARRLVRDVCRVAGIFAATYYNYKPKTVV